MLRVVLMPASWILNLVPGPAVLALAHTLGLFGFAVIRFRREFVLENLRLAFGGEKSEAEILKIARENYTHYILTFFEWIQSISWSAKDFREKTGFQWQVLQDQMKKGQGGFVVTSHLGNWEFAIQTGTAHGMRADIIVKKQRGKLIVRFFEWYRSRFGGGIIYESGTARDILRSVASARFPIFVLDQFMGPPIGLPVKFFGQKAGTAAALALLSEKRDVPVFTAYNYRDSNGRLNTVVEALPKEPVFSEDKDTRLYEKTQFYNDVLESQVRRYPHQWLWLHRRWKPYVGEPRWRTPLATATVLIAIAAVLLGGCSTKELSATPTGIAIPPDPTIAVPQYGNQDSTKETVVGVAPNPGVPVPEARPEEPVKTKAKAKAKKKIPAVSQAPQPTKPDPKPASIPAFDIVPVDKVPFEIGERMEVELNWMALPAGRAIIEVRDGPEMNGRPTFHLWGNVLSSRIVDTVYHVDNTIESYIDKSGFIPYKFLLSMFETQQKKETRVSFDHPSGKAYYWAKRISERWGNQDIDRTDTLTPKARDMFSALYYARALNYQMNQKQSFTIYENGQNWNVDLLPVGYELITGRAGAFQCWKIKVEVKLNNVLAPTGDLYMWLSDDSRKYLVRFTAKVKIGSLYGTLVSVRER